MYVNQSALSQIDGGEKERDIVTQRERQTDKKRESDRQTDKQKERERGR